jgi:flagellar biosynthetic protein FliR
MVKVLGVLVLSFAFYPVTKPYLLQDINMIGLNHFWLLTAFYTISGLLIGYLVKAILNIYVAGGSVITQQVGFGAVRYFDPSAGQQTGPFEQLIKWTVIVMIISSGALLPMLKGGVGSFSTIQFAHFGKFAHSPEYFFRFFKSVFLSALLLASPLIFTNILLMTVLGIVARTVPQMNVIMVSFVVNIGVGLLIFIVNSNEFFQVAYKLYVDKLGEWFQFIS